MRVLMLTQKIDRDDDQLGFMHLWSASLAARVDRLDILALSVGDYDLPGNVTVDSMGKERGLGRAGILRGFYRGLLRRIGTADVLFVHMIPRYAVLAAPVAALRRVPMVLWYTHRAVTPELQIAARLVYRITTAHPTSFPLSGPKVRALGHGIDADFFSPGEASAAQPGERPCVVHVARLMRIKRQATLLRALAEGGIDAQAVLVGDVDPGQDASYVTELKTLARDLGIEDRVTFTGGLPAAGVRDWYRRATVAVNLSPPGLFDKTVLESLAVGAPTVVSNPAFDSLLGDHAPRLRIDSPDDSAALAARLRDLLALAPEERRALGLDARERVRAAHSLDGLMDRLANVLRTGEP